MSVGLLSYADTGQQKNRFTRRGRILKGESSHKRAPRTKQYPKWKDSARYEPFDKPHGSVIGVPETSGPSGAAVCCVSTNLGAVFGIGASTTRASAMPSRSVVAACGCQGTRFVTARRTNTLVVAHAPHEGEGVAIETVRLERCHDLAHLRGLGKATLHRGLSVVELLVAPLPRVHGITGAVAEGFVLVS